MKVIKVELNEEDLEFICIGLRCYVQRSLKNLKEESQEKVRTTLRKMDETREKLRSDSEEKLRQMISFRRYICPYCGFDSNEMFPIKYYESGSSGYRTFSCPNCKREIEE